MAQVELSKRGKLILVLPLVFVAYAVFIKEPYVAFSAAFLFSIIFYSRYKISNCTVEFQDDIPKGNKTVEEPFRVKHRVLSDDKLDLDLSVILDEGFEIKDEGSMTKDLRTNADFSYDLMPNSRGYHELGEIKGWLYDPLKVYKRSFVHQIEEEVVVQSSKRAIKKAKTYSKRSYAEEFVEDPSAFTVRSNEFEGIREFHPGDSLRDIHWKSFSKFQKLMTRVYERVSPIGTQLLLDCSPSMRRSLPNGTTKLDHSVYIALQILKNFEIQGHDIGMTAYDHKHVIFHQNPDSKRATFKKLYNKVSDLPGSLEPKDVSFDRYQGSVDISELGEEEKQFSNRIGELISKSGREEIAGVLSSVDQMKARGEKRKLVIIISDLEMQPEATVKAVEYLKEMKNEVWMIVPFSPWYELEEVDEDTLEKAYKEYENLEKILSKLERLRCLIFEVHPEKEGFQVLDERERRKT